MRHRLTLALVFVSTLFAVLPLTAKADSKQTEVMAGYASKPLETQVFDYTYTMVDVAKFNNWLNTNYQNLDTASMKGPREHLYYLINSYVSDLYIKNGVILPGQHDLILETLFFWSERLGVYGSNLFYNKIKQESAAQLPPLQLPPESIEIATEYDMYVINSAAGNWSVRIPYYFMIGDMKDFVSTNNMATQLLIISTGASKDKSQVGHSQATIMFIYSPSKEFAEFQDYWIEQFSVNQAKTKQVGGTPSIYTYNEDIFLHQELLFKAGESGSFLIAYMGMDGTYQHNRQHFVDFLAKNGF